jgi:hypothetical protein
MDPTELTAAYEYAVELKQLRDSALFDADAAAHTLARHVSDHVKGPRGTFDVEPLYLRQLVEVYDLCWTQYLSARDE